MFLAVRPRKMGQPILVKESLVAIFPPLLLKLMVLLATNYLQGMKNCLFSHKVKCPKFLVYVCNQDKQLSIQKWVGIPFSQGSYLCMWCILMQKTKTQGNQSYIVKLVLYVLLAHSQGLLNTLYSACPYCGCTFLDNKFLPLHILAKGSTLQVVHL